MLIRMRGTGRTARVTVLAAVVAAHVAVVGPAVAVADAGSDTSTAQDATEAATTGPPPAGETDGGAPADDAGEAPEDADGTDDDLGTTPPDDEGADGPDEADDPADLADDDPGDDPDAGDDTGDDPDAGDDTGDDPDAADPADDDTNDDSDDPDADDDADDADDGSEDGEEGGEEGGGTDEGSGPRAVIVSGNAVANGSEAATDVSQVAVVTVGDTAVVRVEQYVIVINLGGAIASTGGNGAAAVGAPGDGSAALVSTGDAAAAGNLSSTEVDQRLAVVATSGEVRVGQDVEVLHIGLSRTRTGDNVAASTAGGGWVVLETGSAYAIGNFADVTVLQAADVGASGDADVRTDQRTAVAHLGLALADAGGNLAIGEGDIEVLSGAAIAEGNVSTAGVEQTAIASALGDARVHVRQATSVVNVGIAIARTGGNGAGATSGDDALDGMLLTLQLDLEELLDRLLTGDGLDGAEDAGVGLLASVSRLLASTFDSLLDLVATDTVDLVSDWTDPETGATASIVQRVFTFDLGFAAALTGDNHAAAGPTSPGLGEVIDRALVALTTGSASSIGNLSDTVVCQRSTVDTTLDAPSCLPEPEEPAEEPTEPTPASPPPATEAPSGEPTPVDVAPQVAGLVLVAPVTRVVAAAALPVTGASDLQAVAGSGVVLLLAGVVLLGVRRRRPDETAATR